MLRNIIKKADIPDSGDDNRGGVARWEVGMEGVTSFRCDGSHCGKNWWVGARGQCRLSASLDAGSHALPFKLEHRDHRLVRQHRWI